MNRERIAGDWRGQRGNTEGENNGKAQNSFIPGPHHSETDGIAEKSSSEAEKESKQTLSAEQKDQHVSWGPPQSHLHQSQWQRLPWAQLLLPEAWPTQVCSRTKAAVNSFSLCSWGWSEGGRGSQGSHSRVGSDLGLSPLHPPSYRRPLRERALFSPLNTNKALPVESAVAAPRRRDAKFGHSDRSPKRIALWVGQFQQNIYN